MYDEVKMHKAIEKLIKVLQETKEELTKNVNQMYGGTTPNMVKDESQKADIIRPDVGYGKTTIKQITPKPPANPEKPYGKIIMKNKYEELFCAENGQWSLMEKDAKNPALVPKDRKVKELQGKIDAGTYKPDPTKIAEAMIKPKK